MKTKKKKKLIIATDNFFPRWDGIVRVIYETVPQLKSDFDITIVAPDFSPKFQWDEYTKNLVKNRFKGIKIIYFPIMNLKLDDYYPANPNKKVLEKIIKNADIVWTHALGKIGTNAINIAKRLNKKVVHFVHSVDWQLFAYATKLRILSYVGKGYVKRYYNKVDLLLLPYEELSEKLNTLGIKKEYKICHLGVNLKQFKPKNKKLIKKAFNIHGLSMGYCGRLAKEKNVLLLLKILNKLRKKIDVELIVVGNGIDSYIKKFTSSQGVKYFYPSPFLDVYYNAIDVFVLPSLTETTSLATLEAMACGCAVVVPRIGYIKHYIKDEYNGLSIPIENRSRQEIEKHYYKAVQRLLLNPSLRRKISENAIKTVKEKFDIKSTIECLRKTLKSLV